MKAQNTRISNIEQHLSNPGSSSGSPLIVSPMDLSPNESTQGSPNTAGPCLSPPIADNPPHGQASDYDERLDRIDGRHNRMERALGRITSMLSGFAGSPQTPLKIFFKNLPLRQQFQIF